MKLWRVVITTELKPRQRIMYVQRYAAMAESLESAIDMVRDLRSGFDRDETVSGYEEEDPPCVNLGIIGRDPTPEEKAAQQKTSKARR
jgi:hypothetical protein